MMKFSAEQRQKAARQIMQRGPFEHNTELFEFGCADGGIGLELDKGYVETQCQINAAVELLRQAKRALQVAGYSPSSITDFLSAFPEGGRDE